jgi:acyl-CoA synthetase (AMP-forming)/AMP-acid ligase II
VTCQNTIAGALLQAANTPNGIKAVEHDGRTLDIPYETLLASALTIGGAFGAHGLDAGDRVALVLPGVCDFLQVFFGISSAGLVPVPLFPPTQAGDVATFSRQARQLLVASRAACVVTTAGIAPLLRTARADDDGFQPRILTIDTLSDAPSLGEPIAVSPEAPALIQFTSGSTASPKGAVLSHACLLANISAIGSAKALHVTRDDVGVSWLPLYHDMGLIGMLLTGVHAGSTAVVMSPVLFLKRPTAWLEAISRYRGTISFAPNFAYELCVRRVKDSQIASLDLSSWRIAGCGAEPIRYQTLRGFADRFGRAGFRAASFTPSYGLAEHTLAVTVAPNRLNVDVVDSGRLVRESRAVSVVGAPAEPTVCIVGCGQPFPGHAVEIVDEDGRQLPERHVGRIVARGPSTMMEYFEDPAATAETLPGEWLHTGDLGYVADGQLFVCGRTKDLIIRHGRKYHPPDLESAIASVDGLRPSAVVVFGINRLEEPDEVVAVLEARASQADDIIDHVRRRVRETAGLELDSIVVTPPGTIPRTTSGKVRRSETRARFQAGTLIPPGRGAFADGSPR